MRYVLPIILFLALAAPAYASPACNVAQAKKDVRVAEKRLKEAKRILQATRKHSCRYRPAVGRWVRLSRRVGWPWSSIDGLMYVIERESKGNPKVYNTQGSGAAGLLQLMPMHYKAFDPTNPKRNLAKGLRSWKSSGWQPWAL